MVGNGIRRKGVRGINEFDDGGNDELSDEIDFCLCQLVSGDAIEPDRHGSEREGRKGTH